MPTPLQSASDAAFKKLPYGMQRIGAPAVLPANGAGSEKMRAGVEPGNPVSPLLVKDQADFTNPDYAPQLLRHEQTHRQQANWPEKLQQELPPINSKDPYNYGGVEGIERIGSNPMKLSTEQMASAEQHLQADKQNGNVPEPLRKLDENFQAVPLSVMEPTDPHGKGINTTPRTPGLPMNRPWGTEKLLEADDTIPVKPGSGQAPWEKYASSSASGPWEKYGATPQPEESAPVPTTGRLNMPMHEAEAIQKENTPVPATSNKDAVANFLPTAGGTLGGGIGTLITPGIGTAAGSAFGSVAGERAKERLLGQKPDYDAETKAGIMGAASGPLEDIPSLLPSKSNAVEGLRGVERMANNTPVSMAATKPALGEFEDYVSTGGLRPKVITQLGKRIAEPLLPEGGEATEPVNFPEARDFYTHVSRTTAKPGFLRRAIESPEKPSMRMEAGNVRQALHDDLVDAASSIGQGQQYQNAMKEYADAAKLIKAGKLVGTAAAGEGVRRLGLLGKAAHLGMNAGH